MANSFTERDPCIASGLKARGAGGREAQMLCVVPGGRGEGRAEPLRQGRRGWPACPPRSAAEQRVCEQGVHAAVGPRMLKRRCGGARTRCV